MQPTLTPSSHLLPKKFYHTLPTKPAEKICWPKIPTSALSLAIVELIASSKEPLIIITQDLQTASLLESELLFFLDGAHKAKEKNHSHSTPSIFTFPEWETLPYDHFSPNQDIISERLLALYKLPELKHGAVITSINALAQRLPVPAYIQQYSFVLKIGDEIDLDALRRRLEHHGYHYVTKVMEHGEFAVRGSLLDLFPMGGENPYRIDLFGQKVDSIRIFDVDSQLTTTKTNSIELLPAKEFPLTKEAIDYFRQNWREHFNGDPTTHSVYNSVSNGESPGGIEYYLPLFFPATSSLADYFPASCKIITIGDIHESAAKFWQEIESRYLELKSDILHPILPPADAFWSIEEVFAKLAHWPCIVSQQADKDEKVCNSTHSLDINQAISPLPDLVIDHKAPAPLAKLNSFIQDLQKNGSRILFCAESAGRIESILALFRTIDLHPHPCANWQEFLAAKHQYCITSAALAQGFSLAIDAKHKLTIIAEADLFGEQVVEQRRKRREQPAINPENLLKNLTELNIGDPVVHIEHGVGRYLGLQTLTTDNITAEFLAIEYADSAKLYVPVSSLHLISRYTGVSADAAPYHRLGSSQWEKEKRKALEKIRDVAAELLALYAKREAKPGFAFKIPEPEYQQFAAAFPFVETQDQKRAIEDVITDMTSQKHMDRLICGDVGFGKTEVAMRAAFIAACNRKQVAVLVPTTILAQQHYQNFCDRFADWPLRISMVSRFRTAKEQKNTLEELAAGKIDIIIGTHRLIQPDIQFSDLGLLIIDEEHRFGVKQKERIKQLRPEVDMLALTATPIPRTLNFAFSGLRDFSIIATPPARRLSIKTFLHQRERGVIREAIAREILRGGQVYFLHNDIATIPKIMQEIAQLVPNVRMQAAHGKMRELQLERIMHDFYHQRYNVLVCTTIIESGIDVPTANTIIIDRADKFGLAQLHQLRGRVGRSHHQAYAYLLIPPLSVLAPETRKRLEVISAMEDLGTGFNLATHDLEIRGAGELLGEEQSGQIEGIGFSLYVEYLEEAVKALKQGQEPDWNEVGERNRTAMELQIPLLFPAEYINDVNIRLTLYKRLANAVNDEEIMTLQEEVIDRFGIIPKESKNLFRVAHLTLAASSLGIKKITAGKYGSDGALGVIEFTPQPKINSAKIIDLIQRQPQTYKLRGTNKLEFRLVLAKADTHGNSILEFLERLLPTLES